jgi:hypothetical protein
MENSVDSIFLLKNHLEQLLKEKTDLQTHFIKTSDQRKMLFRKELEIENHIETLNKEITEYTKKIKDTEEHMLLNEYCSETSLLDSPLSKEEMNKIVTHMDKKDYRDFGNYPRWIDLQKIIDFVVEIKCQYDHWNLIEITRVPDQILNIPPNHKYIYTFQDPHGRRFTLEH